MSELRIYPQPKRVSKCEAEYKLQARLIGSDKWQDVPIYAVNVDSHDPREAGFAQFDFDDSVEVRMSYNSSRYIKRAFIRCL